MGNSHLKISHNVSQLHPSEQCTKIRVAFPFALYTYGSGFRRSDECCIIKICENFFVFLYRLNYLIQLTFNNIKVHF
jgi:hypothetical protein